jgi:hypothetical protein
MQLAAQRDVMALVFDFQGLQFKDGTDCPEYRIALHRGVMFSGCGPLQLTSAAPGIITFLSALILIYDNVGVYATQIAVSSKKFWPHFSAFSTCDGGISQRPTLEYSTGGKNPCMW